MGNTRHSRIESTGPAEPGPRPSENGTVEPGSSGSNGDDSTGAEQGVVVPVAGAASQSRPDRTTAGSDSFGVLRAVVEKGRVPWGKADDPAATRWAHLWDLLTSTQYPSGKRREVARIAITATKTGWEAVLSDYTISYKLTVRCEHLEDIWAALNEGIEDPEADWVEIKRGDGYHSRKQSEKEKLEKGRSGV